MGNLETNNSLLGGNKPEHAGFEEPPRLLPGVTIEVMSSEVEEIYPDSEGQLRIPHYGLPTERKFVNL